MHEPDDRLAGDHVWELFPYPYPPARQAEPGPERYFTLAAVGGVIAATWFFWPPLGVVVACLAVAARDLRAGWRLSRSGPDPAGGAVCSLFSYAWGAWKLGMTAFALMFVVIVVKAAGGWGPEPPVAFFAAAILWFGGFATSAALTAAGLFRAFQHGMRIWVGEGINRARALFLGMLLVGFTALVLMPMCLWLVGLDLGPDGGRRAASWFLMLFLGCQIGGPVLLLVFLDWLTRHVVASHPGKFGPKVPAVGKWDNRPGNGVGSASVPPGIPPAGPQDWS